MTTRWTSLAERVIAETLAGLGNGYSLKQATNALKLAYPFGARANHPYRVWCACVRQALARLKEADAIPRWYKVTAPEELAFLQRIGEMDLTRGLTFDCLPIGVYGDWLADRGDARHRGWHLLYANQFWPVFDDRGRSCQWHERRHSLFAKWEIPPELFRALRYKPLSGADSTGRVYPYTQYRSGLAAMCDLVLACAKV